MKIGMDFAYPRYMNIQTYMLTIEFNASSLPDVIDVRAAIMEGLEEAHLLLRTIRLTPLKPIQAFIRPDD